jgi:hypothetical protein
MVPVLAACRALCDIIVVCHFCGALLGPRGRRLVAGHRSRSRPLHSAANARPPAAMAAPGGGEETNTKRFVLSPVSEGLRRRGNAALAGAAARAGGRVEGGAGGGAPHGTCRLTA